MHNHTRYSRSKVHLAARGRSRKLAPTTALSYPRRASPRHTALLEGGGIARGTIETSGARPRTVSELCRPTMIVNLVSRYFKKLSYHLCDGCRLEYRLLQKKEKSERMSVAPYLNDYFKPPVTYVKERSSFVQAEHIQ